MSTPAAAPQARPVASGMPHRPAPTVSTGTRLVVGIGEFAVSSNAGDVIVTHALGSCVAVCVADRAAGVAGLIHVLLPDSTINPLRATEQPAAFADTGIPLLVATAVARGMVKRHAIVRIAGGADVAHAGGVGSFSIGRRNILAARLILWKLGLLIDAESVGGAIVRTVYLEVGAVGVRVTSGANTVLEL